MDHPTGTVTFLFSDIEGSTKIARDHPETWEILRARHHHILRRAIEASNGFVFEIVGDGFCAAFHSIDHAIQAAVKTQTDLEAEDWGDTPIRVRIGIHTGKADLQSTGLYRGYMTLSHVQRLMSTGHGGQTLLSATAGPLALENLPPGITLRDLGECRLKDMPLPERIFQLVIPDLRSDFPPLRTLESIPNNLPLHLTSFIGRHKEINDIKRHFRRARLVTLLGPGGSGKSRLSLEVAGKLLPDFPHGVWLVDLVPVTEASEVERSALAALHMPPETFRPAIDMLCDYLSDRKTLLVVDNCEHLIEPVARMVSRLLLAAPGLRVLVTSRESLGISGEVKVRVPSLRLPRGEDSQPARLLRQYDSIRLFADRAAAASPAFVLTEDNIQTVAQICRQLDGIPLALELAAAKVGALSVGQIAARLGDRFRLLTGGSRSSLKRHQTLQAALDWSYNLLSEPEQVLFRSLAVFVGGWTLDAAESVCAQERLQREEVFDLLEQLINKSLVVADGSGSETRYRFLETIRQYAGEKLTEAEENRSLYRRHLAYFLELAENAEPHLIRPEQLEWFDCLEMDHDNLRAAIERSLKQEDPEAALRLCAALGKFWLVRGYCLEGARWLERSLARSTEAAGDVVKIARLHALFNDCSIASALDNLERLKGSANAGLALCIPGSNALDTASANYWMGVAFSRNGDLEQANAYALRSMEEYQKVGDMYGQLIVSLSLLESVIWIKGWNDQIVPIFDKYLRAARTVGDRSLLSTFLFLAGLKAWDHHQLDEAEAYASELKTAEAETHTPGFTSLLEGNIAHARGDHEFARSSYIKFQEQQSLLGEKNAKSMSLHELVCLEREEGDLVQARSYAREALDLALEMGSETLVGYHLVLLAHIEFLQGDMEEAFRNIRTGLPKLWKTEMDVHKVDPLILSAWLFADNHSQIAIQLLGAVEAHHRRVSKYPMNPITRKDFDFTLSQARTHLDESAFESAFKEGGAMSLDDAIALASKTLDEM